MGRAMTIHHLDPAIEEPTVPCDIAARLAALRAHTVSIGETLPGGYVLRTLLGSGGMGRIFLAEQRSLGREVAIKVAHAHLESAHDMSNRLSIEALAMSRVRHRSSVAIYDLRTRADGVPFVVMERVRGQSLTSLVRQGPLEARRAVNLVVQLLGALEEAHDSGVLHRDVKPDNIVVTNDHGTERVILIDYGLALIRDGTRVVGATVPGVMYGTPGYMSPEQSEGARVDARTDVYSSAVVLHTLLTGAFPARRIPSASRTSLRSRRIAPRVDASLGEPLAAVLTGALDEAPARRPASAATFASALQACVPVARRRPVPAMARGVATRLLDCG